jgi:hypothetical protein
MKATNLILVSSLVFTGEYSGGETTRKPSTPASRVSWLPGLQRPEYGRNPGFFVFSLGTTTDLGLLRSPGSLNVSDRQHQP